MMRSTDRFLTTHAGSLPRPDDLVRIMYAKEEGQAVERAELASHVRNAGGRSRRPAERSRRRHHK
jgi:5-methyltetrahydropteroyltriglutamate--homocysteine methyltransferase